MKRRQFIAAIGGVTASAYCPMWARAQQAMPVIGFIRSTSAASAARLVTAFRQGLEQAGFVDGKQVTIEYRWADDQLDRLPELAGDLIRRQPALIAGNVLAIQPLKALTSAIPIVFVSGSDPVRIGLVPSLNRPGGNLTGVVFTSTDLTAKRLEQLDAIIPKSVAIAALFDPNAPDGERQIKDVEEAGRKIDRQVLIMKAADEGELHGSFAEMVQRGAGGLLIGNSAFFLGRRRQLAMLAARHGLPASASNQSFADAGILMSYGASQTDAYRRAGEFAGRILKGAKPSDMPVELATKIDLVINVATAKALGITVPPSLLATADEVIE
jgi:putative ABC transport system substrate-binding protein